MHIINHRVYYIWGFLPFLRLQECVCKESNCGLVLPFFCISTHLPFLMSEPAGMLGEKFRTSVAIPNVMTLPWQKIIWHVSQPSLHQVCWLLKPRTDFGGNIYSFLNPFLGPLRTFVRSVKEQSGTSLSQNLLTQRPVSDCSSNARSWEGNAGARRCQQSSWSFFDPFFFHQLLKL